MNTVIVGNGIVALTVAHRLARRGHAITLVGDPARPGSATLAAAAMLNSFAELDAGSLSTEPARTKFELSRAATRRWRELGAELGGLAALGFGTGTFVVADAGDAADDAGFDALLAALRAHDEPHALVALAEIPGYAPERLAARAVRIDGEGWIDPRRVVAALDRALDRATSVEVIAGSAVRLRHDGGAITGVELADGRLVEGRHYLIANGARLSALLADSALPVRVQPVFYGVGTTLELRADHHAACLRARGVYSAPYGDRVIVGSTNLVATTPVDDPTAATRLLAAAIARLDRRFAGAELLRANVGWRPISLDAYPLIGTTSIANLLIAGGTRRDGFHLAPVIADHLSAVLEGEPGDPRFAAFAPERAPLGIPPEVLDVHRASVVKSSS